MQKHIDILDYAEAMDCEELHMFVDKKTGLKGMIAIHSTKLGPALGGCRVLEYNSTEEAAYDVIRLAQGMTKKAAISNLALGGGKAVLLKPKEIKDRKAYFEAFGRKVEHLNGTYITAMDMGTEVNDMDVIRTQTSHVGSTSTGRFSLHDPSPMTAFGVMRAMEAAVKFTLNKDSLEGIRVTIQGLGHVGHDLCRRLQEQGANISVFDINEKRVQQCVSEFNAIAITNDQAVYTAECDLFAPCARGAVLNKNTIPQLNCTMIVGAANNQLDVPEDMERIMERGILYAPDYAANAGGLIHEAEQYYGKTFEQSQAKVSEIYNTMMRIFVRSKALKGNTVLVAEQIVEERLR